MNKKLHILVLPLALGLVFPASVLVPYDEAAALFLKKGSVKGIEDDIEDKIEDDVEDDVEDEIEDDIEDDIEDKIEDDVEDDIEDDVEDDIEDDLEDAVEDKIEEDVEDDSSDKVSRRVDENISDRIDNSGKGRRGRSRDESRLEDSLSDSSSGRASRNVSVSIAGVPGTVNEEFFDAAEDAIKADRQNARRTANDDRQAAKTAARVARDVALEAGVKSEEVIEAEYRAALDQADLNRETAKDEADETYEVAREELREQEDQYDELASNSGPGSGGFINFENVGDSRDLVDIGQDEDGFDIATGEWLILSTMQEFEQIKIAGFRVRASERLEMLDRLLSRIASPAGQSLRQSEITLRRLAPDAEIDYNHLYAPQLMAGDRRAGIAPLRAMPLNATQRKSTKKIGLIDTAVATGSVILKGRNITKRDFVRSKNGRPSDHGTAVASILTGQSRNFAGLLPQSRLFSASAFEILPKRGATATTASLVRSLDWMAANGVGIVNMSLTGPKNGILQQTISRLRQRGLLVVAAIGNGGPNAKPLYPAGYKDVVSVTAVNGKRNVFRLANRGKYLDFAAPGVNIRHAAPNGALDTSSGTSIAAPFVAAAILLATDKNGRINGNSLNKLRRSAVDLGKPGHDPVYGYGLIRPLP